MTEAPKVDCPKEGKKVPVWYCLGSFMQQKEQCPELISATVSENHAEVDCKAKRRLAKWSKRGGKV